LDTSVTQTGRGDVSNRPTDTDKAPSAESLAASWPGGWYVFENGRVDGPFSADETFRLEHDAEDGKPRLVSRKGFTQWYALKDLSEIFKMTEGLGQRTAQATELTETQLAQARAALAEAKGIAPASAQVSPATNAATQAPQRATHHASHAPKVQKGQKGHKAQAKAHQAAAATANAVVREAGMTMSAPAPAAATLAGAAAVPREVPAAARTSTTERPPQSDKVGRPLSTSAKLQQEYFFLRGRLRLGKIRNPWITSFFTLPLTLGILWGRWYGEVSREVAYHAENAGNSPLPPTWMAYVPILHIWVILKLARAISAMEAQNRYRSVSPAAAAMFALLPPFAMAYLQDALNRHWMLHVRHAIARRKGPEVAGVAET
jgi:hypothetical protein